MGLGIEIEGRPSQEHLRVFRAKSILHGKVGEVFESSLRLARKSGYLKKRGDAGGAGHDLHTGPARGQGYCNLLADGMPKFLKVPAAGGRTAVGEWAVA